MLDLFTMSLKETIEAWNAGIAHAMAGQYSDAVDRWTEMSEPGAKIYYNIASMFIKLGNLDEAQSVSQINVVCGSAGRFNRTSLFICTQVALRAG